MEMPCARRSMPHLQAPPTDAAGNGAKWRESPPLSQIRWLQTDARSQPSHRLQRHLFESIFGIVYHHIDRPKFFDPRSTAA